VGHSSASAEMSSVQSVEGKSLLVFPLFIAPDINPDCVSVANMFQIIRLNFEAESKLTIVCNNISGCQEGWYLEVDTSTIHANVKDCSGPDNADIMSYNFTITLIANVWVTGRYSIESFVNDSNCVEEGEFIGLKLQ
jgi:hypothetical protein